MIITVVCDVLGEENNGTTIAAMNLIRYLRGGGHTVRILCGDQDKIGQENYYIVPNYNLGIFNRYVEKVGVTLAKPVEEVILNALDGADHVHIMIPLPLGLATAKIASSKNMSITAGFHMQAENFTCHIKMNKLKPVNHLVYKYIYKHLYRYVGGVHYPTQFIHDVFVKNVKNKPMPKAYIISNGVHGYVQKRESQKPQELQDKIVILTTGRFAREKSQDTLIKAIKYSKYKDKIQLILAGRGPKEKYYRNLAKTLPVEPMFKLFGRNEIIDVLNYCDLYVHPAEVELEGIACIEAIACGKMTIVSNSKLAATKGFAIDDKCIFKNRNPKDLARVIDYWIENKEERKEYEDKYLKSATDYDQELCMQKMEQMIFEVSGEKAKA